MSSIGVFDSGVGGLTVLKSLAESFPNESFHYLGDTARLPYGSKSPETIHRYCEQNMNWLMSKNIKAIVIACNSASAHWKDKTWNKIPVYNVIEPGVAKAISSSKNYRIGVLGTRATIQSEAYTLGLKKLGLSLGKDVQVFSQACPLFVPLVEEGWTDDPLTNLVTYRYVQPLVSQQIDTLILGCTHYPVLKNSIAKVTGAHGGIELIDSGSSVVEVLKNDFQNSQLTKNTDPQEIHLHFTDLSTHLENLTVQLLGGLAVVSIDKVDLV